MDIKSIFAVVGFAFTLSTYFYYVKSINESNARPTLSVWISWVAMDVAVLIGMVLGKSFSLQIAAFIVGVAWVIRASLRKKAVVAWQGFDTACMTFVGIAFYSYFQFDRDTGIVISLTAMVIGSTPMYVNMLRGVGNEPFKPWLLMYAGTGFQLLSIRNWLSATPSTSPLVNNIEMASGYVLNVIDVYPAVTFAIIQSLALALMCLRFVRK